MISPPISIKKLFLPAASKILDTESTAKPFAIDERSNWKLSFFIIELSEINSNLFDDT